MNIVRRELLDINDSIQEILSKLPNLERRVEPSTPNLSEANIALPQTNSVLKADWSRSEMEQLREMRAAGIGYERIALQIGKSVQQCKNKLKNINRTK